MRDQARVVVIGGGIVGCSVLYHLAKPGWSDVTQALAKGARDRSAEIDRNTEVTGIERTPAGEWLVKTMPSPGDVGLGGCGGRI